MLQVIRLVTPGRVDSLIAFDELPKRFLVGIKKRDESGTLMLREWLRSIGSVATRIIEQKNIDTQVPEKIEVKYPFTYYLDYKTVNSDKDKWIEIVSYLRRVVDPNVRLMDRIEDMAKPASVDSYQEFQLEPADIPVIPIKPESIIAYVSPATLEVPAVERAEQIAEKEEIEMIKKRRGRPKKVVEV